jgi:hypothetical protein
MPEKTECKKGADDKALCNYEWCKDHPTLCSKYCEPCAESIKDVSCVSARLQRDRQVVSYVDDLDDETTSQRAAGVHVPNDPGIRPEQSLDDLCLAFPPTISMTNMPSERCRKQSNAGTVIQGMGNARCAEGTVVNLLSVLRLSYLVSLILLFQERLKSCKQSAINLV